MNAHTDTLLCWHAERAGLDVLKRTIKALRNRRIELERVIYLVQQGLEPNIPKVMEDVSIEPITLVVDDPTKHTAIYRLIQEQVLPRIQGCPGGLHINLSPGTPAMHAVWLVLHAGGALPEKTRLWSSQYNQKTKRSRIDPVEFEITTYLAEIRRVQRIEPERATYEPEARSSARRAALERLERYAKVVGAPLLILGERGTGKTRLVETFITTLKQREKIITVACGGLDSSLAESLLFGHCRGAFTGAEKDRAGLLKEADGGILFLDEIQDLPRPVQRKLVQVFQDRQHRFRPVGSDKETNVDIELVCASNLAITELREELDADLFDRLSHLTVRIPPLRECREDLEHDWLNVWRELRHHTELPETAPWSPKIEQALRQHPLPGNLRDLQRLAILLAAWWSDQNNSLTVKPALDEWSKWTATQKADDEEFGNGTRNERVKWFRARLAHWAKEQQGTWTAAAKMLACDEKTLRADAALLDGNIQTADFCDSDKEH